MKRNEDGTTRGAPLFGRALVTLGTLHGGIVVATPMELAFQDRGHGGGRKESNQQQLEGRKLWRNFMIHEK